MLLNEYSSLVADLNLSPDIDLIADLSHNSTAGSNINLVTSTVTDVIIGIFHYQFALFYPVYSNSQWFLDFFNL